MFWTADALSRLAIGYWPAATLIAAVELRVFDALDSGPATAGVLAETLGVDAGRLASLLDALASTGLLTKAHDAYAIAAAARPWLSWQSPACMLDALAYNADLYRQWADLAAVVRGAAPAGAGRQLGADPQMTRRFVLGMDAKARAFAPALASAIDLSGAATLLDVGAGPGTLTRLLAERYPAVRATLLDLPPVLAVAADICAASPVADRLAFHAADYRAGPLPGPFDAVLYAGALHQETPASAAALFDRFRQALRAGGRLFVVDLMLDDDRTSPAFSAMFQLNMLLLRPGSRVFGSGEVETMLGDAGFANVDTRSIDGTPYRIVQATAL